MKRGDIKTGQEYKAKYHDWIIRVDSVGDCLISRTALRPYKTVIRYTYVKHETLTGKPASCDLSFFVSNFKAIK